MMKEARAAYLMRVLGIKHEQMPRVNRVILSMEDGSWMEFTGAQVMKLTMRGRPLIQIRGEPKLIVDSPSLFGMLFPEGCKYL
jgi:NACalpha-BTF3-like transcription factor